MEQFANSISQAESIEQLTRPMLRLLERITHLESTYLTTIDGEAGVEILANTLRR